MKNPRECFLIEDDLDDQEIFYMALQEMDPTTKFSVASDGREGIRILSLRVSEAPDYIFIDVNMPVMNGMTCLQELRKLNHLNNTRIIMYSTSSDSRIVNESKLLGADDFIIKPVGLDTLVNILSKIMAV